MSDNKLWRNAAAELNRCVAEALAEDIGIGDVTASAFRDMGRGQAVMLAKEAGVVSGMGAVREVFRQLHGAVRVVVLKRDGEDFAAGDLLCRIQGPMDVLFTGERTALNFVQRLSGVATITRAFVDALGAGARPGIYDTRKTTPGLRVLQKQAVVHGGGRNHRVGLDDMAMLKNNHIDAAGSVAGAVARLAADGFFKRRPRLPLCIEARDEGEAMEAVRERADIIMLDNMAPAEIRRVAGRLETAAAKLGRRMPAIEVSGNITLGNVRRYWRLPIDRISIGALTHSAPSIDISMRLGSGG